MNQHQHLANAPLMEAWLEIQWKLSKTDVPNIEMDEQFPFALGKFTNSIRNEYPITKALEQAQLQMPIRQVRYRFNKSENTKWPLLHIGPGIASVNMGKEYSWESFKPEVHYLVKHLCEAYDNKISPLLFALRYRNVLPFNFLQSDILEFLTTKFNFTFVPPAKIPGENIKTSHPTGFSFSNSYSMIQPDGNAKYTIASATENEKKELVVLLDLEFISGNLPKEKLTDKNQLNKWLEEAHAILYTWFSSFIEGPLYEEFQ